MVLQSYVLWESRTLPGLHLYREVFSLAEDLVFFALPGTPTGAEMGRTLLAVKVLFCTRYPAGHRHAEAGVERLGCPVTRGRMD